ncbi:MAG: TlpA family protein disulfide reductase [Bacteriovoracaceae bacterium]|jgi:thiol-disulfide isomerase/thioredoxin|nr:TlpA family protein disulfide reductase [Bacteriovoracaceae bacterium]
MKFLILLIPLLTSCFTSEDISGTWSFKLNTQNNPIPFKVNIDKEQRFFEITNSEEILKFEITKNENKYIIPIANHDSAIELELKDKKLVGYWIKYNRKSDYKLSVIGKKEELDLNVKFPTNFPKRWKIIFTDKMNRKKDALLLFTKNHASILTSTGDYRYLRPVFKENRLNLYGFDGTFAFNFSGIWSLENFKGTMYAGLNWTQNFSAKPDYNFLLPDPTTVTKVKKSALDLCLPTLNDDKICLNRKSKRPKVIQIFGSWCPNCIDETKFIQDYKNKHKPKVDFYIVAFERAPNKKLAIKALKKARKLYGIDYPIMIGSYTKDKKVEDIFYGVDNFASFPTTVYVDKNNNIRKVHSGFTGPATGKYYEEFVREFDFLLKKLQSE